jgi:tetratricopeptide (TPR) repeat protein
MGFEAAKCPECGADIQVPTDRDVAKCMYCGKDIVVKQATADGDAQRVANWMQLAEAAAEDENHDEAYTYFTKVLEVEPDNFKAWLGKGLAAGWGTNLKQDRYNEMIGGIQRAIELAPETEKENVTKIGALRMTEVTIAYFALSKDHLTEFVALDGSWSEHLERCLTMIMGIKVANELDPKSKFILATGIEIAKSVLEGVAYEDPYETDESDKSKAHTLDYMPEVQAGFQKDYDEFTQKLKALDPTFQPPKVEKVSDPAMTGCIMWGIVLLIMFLATGAGIWWLYGKMKMDTKSTGSGTFLTAGSDQTALLGKWVRISMDKAGMQVELKEDGGKLVGVMAEPPSRGALMLMTRGTGLGPRTAQQIMDSYAKAWERGFVKWKDFEQNGPNRWRVQDLANPIDTRADGSWHVDESFKGEYNAGTIALIDADTFEVSFPDSKTPNQWKRIGGPGSSTPTDPSRWIMKYLGWTNLREDKRLTVSSAAWAGRLGAYATGQDAKAACPPLAEVKGGGGQKDSREALLSKCKEENAKLIVASERCPLTSRLRVRVSDYSSSDHVFKISFTQRSTMPMVTNDDRVLWATHFLVSWERAMAADEKARVNRSLCRGAMLDTLPTLAGLELRVYMNETEAKDWAQARRATQDKSDRFEDYVDLAFSLDGKGDAANLPCDMKTPRAATGRAIAWRLASWDGTKEDIWLDWQGIAEWQPSGTCDDAHALVDAK